MTATPVWDAHAADRARLTRELAALRRSVTEAAWRELTRTARRGPSKADGVLIPTRRPLPPSATPIEWRGAL